MRQRHIDAALRNSPKEGGKILDGTGEPMAPPFQSKRMMLDGILPFDVPTGQLEQEAQSVLGHGRYALYIPNFPGGKKFRPRRVLDLGAGVGSFGLWTWKMWPEAWYDAVELDARLHRLLFANLPPGGKVIGAAELARVASKPYDLIRVADSALAESLHSVCSSARVLIVDILQVKE